MTTPWLLLLLPTGGVVGVEGRHPQRGLRGPEHREHVLGHVGQQHRHHVPGLRAEADQARARAPRHGAGLGHGVALPSHPVYLRTYSINYDISKTLTVAASSSAQVKRCSYRQFARTSTVRPPSSCSRAQHIWWKARRGSWRSITLLSTTLGEAEEEEVAIVLAAETQSGICSLETIDTDTAGTP